MKYFPNATLLGKIIFKNSCPTSKHCNVAYILFRYHLQVVEQFGHFPHRNEILSRTDTPEETEFLKNPAFRFDLPLVYGEDGSCKFVKTDDFNERRKVMARKMTVEGVEEEVFTSSSTIKKIQAINSNNNLLNKFI